MIYPPYRRHNRVVRNGPRKVRRCDRAAQHGSCLLFPTHSLLDRMEGCKRPACSKTVTLGRASLVPTCPRKSQSDRGGGMRQTTGGTPYVSVICHPEEPLPPSSKKRRGVECLVSGPGVCVFLPYDAFPFLTRHQVICWLGCIDWCLVGSLLVLWLYNS